MNFRYNTTSTVRSLNKIFHALSTKKSRYCVFFYFLPKSGAQRNQITQNFSIQMNLLHDFSSVSKNAVYGTTR
ncbi:hypothetical protein GCM10023260_12380 [Bartonella acomydis]|uniref:Uncharacterized protein n=1 Tax=Bartonella acomydis TaxID=686234 RepID=A0ABP9MXW9_9HYPH